jgi:hypothetical protein
MPDPQTIPVAEVRQFAAALRAALYPPDPATYEGWQQQDKMLGHRAAHISGVLRALAEGDDDVHLAEVETKCILEVAAQPLPYEVSAPETVAECDATIKRAIVTKSVLLGETSEPMPGHAFIRPGQVTAGLPAADACMVCGQPEAGHLAGKHGRFDAASAAEVAEDVERTCRECGEPVTPCLFDDCLVQGERACTMWVHRENDMHGCRERRGTCARPVPVPVGPEVVTDR